MRFTDIRRHLKPYSMVANRSTTINHAFASSVAPSDSFEPTRVREAIVDLGQDPDLDLTCAYCGAQAETWDHVHATVRDKRFSGHGHRIGNLLPCCKPCNSRKGNKDWRSYLASLGLPDTARLKRERIIDTYLAKYGVIDSIPEHLPEYRQLQDLLRQMLDLLAQADKVAEIVRSKAGAI
jgi:5-methylcytosine-specific restriction endonuclease McrA